MDGRLPDTCSVVQSRVRFELLYRAHAGAVRAYALRRTDAGTADDVVADVFLIAWRRLDAVPDAPLPWLLGVARRVLANRRRGEARGAALVERLGSAAGRAGDEPEPAVADRGVAQALSALSDRDREALLLIAWEGLTATEAAQVLGISRGTFAVALHRARRRFARLLAEQEAPARDESPALEVL